ncbi:hypothetical protein SLA2020_311610 [Shorea laevis]
MRGDAVDALKKCAEALQHGNSRLANAEMGRVLDLAEEETDLMTKRLIRYFAQALACRAYGFHPKYFSFPSPAWKNNVFRFYDLADDVGRAIADVVKGKRKVHVIELVEHMDGYVQWHSILFAAVNDWGDLTHLRLSFLVQEKVEFSKEAKENLIELAECCRIELECNIIAVNGFADIDVSLLEMRDDEFVVVNCMFVFSKMLSEALALEKLLLKVKDVMRAYIMIVVEYDANHNQSDFLLRFGESLKYYSSIFRGDFCHRIEAYFKYQLSNIVACEGSNRVERQQMLALWKSLLSGYGFSIVYLSTELECEWPEGSKRLDNGILVIRITETKDQPLFFISVWKTPTLPFRSLGSNEG